MAALQAKVLAFRKANHLQRATEEEVAEDVDRYQCVKLEAKKGRKVMERWCRDSDKPWAQVAAHVPRRTCGGCGAEV